MRTLNESPLKVIRLQRNSATNNSQETNQTQFGQNINSRHQMLTQNYIEKSRCHSENLQNQKKLGTSYAEQLTLASLNAMLNQSNNPNIKSSSTNNIEYSQVRQMNQQNNINQSLNEKSAKKNNKRVILSALKIRTQIAKNIEEEIDAVDFEQIVQEELIRYRRLRTDSIADSDNLNKEQILKELQAMRQSNSGTNTPLRRQSNALNTSKGQRDIKSLQASKEFNEYLREQLGIKKEEGANKNGAQNILPEVYSPDLKQITSFQRALTELEEEICQMNLNCRKRYDRSRRTLVSRRCLPELQVNRTNNAQYLSSEEEQDYQNSGQSFQLIQNSNHQQQYSLNSVQIMGDSTLLQIKDQEYPNGNLQINNINKGETKNQWRTKICTTDDKQRNLIKVTTEGHHSQSGNFGIFKNQFIQQMQSKSPVKKNFTSDDSSYYMGDIDTTSSKQSSQLSTKKNTCESEEIMQDANKINILLPQTSSQPASKDETQGELQFTPNKQYSVQKHQDYLDRSCGNLVNVFSSKNSYIPTFQFGANGFLNQQIQEKGVNNNSNVNQFDRDNNIRRKGKSSSMTPMKGSIVNQKNNSQIKSSSTNDIGAVNQSELLLNGVSNQSQKVQKDTLDEQNESSNSKYQNSNISINSKNLTNKSLEKSTIDWINDTEYRKNSYSSINKQKKRNLTALHVRGNSQPKEEQSAINEFRQKLLSKVANNIYQKKQSNQSEIGDSNNNTFQIRRITQQKLKNDSFEPVTAINNSLLYLNSNQNTSARLNILNFDNKDLKQNNEIPSSSNNIQANQEKLNNLLKKKYKYSPTKRFNSNNLQNQLMQDCHNKIFTAEDDVTYFTKNLIDSPSRIGKLTSDSAPNSHNENQYLKV